MKALPAVLLLLWLAVAHASPRQLLQGDNAATQQAAAAGVGPSTIKRPPVLNCNQAFSSITRNGRQNAGSSAQSVEPSGAATASAVAGNALTQETAVNLDDVSELPGPPKPRFAGRAAFNASEYEQVVPDQPAGGITPSAWCPNPSLVWIGGTSLDYSSCVLMVPNITSPEGELIAGCSISWFHTPDTRSHIAITAAHCVSLGNGTWSINPSTSIICCAYDPKARNSCPDYATFDINEVRALNSFHQALVLGTGRNLTVDRRRWAHDIAVMSTTRSRTGLIPGKWRVNNWDPTARTMSYSVYGYPQSDRDMEGCRIVNVDGRRRVYSMRGPVIAHPLLREDGTPSTDGAHLFGSSCGGSSGGPIQHIERGGITSVMSKAFPACRANGFGTIIVAAVRGVPWQYGGRPGLTNPDAGVDVWCLKRGM